MPYALQKLPVFFELLRPMFILVFFLFYFFDTFASSVSSLLPQEPSPQVQKMWNKEKHSFPLAFLMTESLSCLHPPLKYLGPHGFVSNPLFPMWYPGFRPIISFPLLMYH